VSVNWARVLEPLRDDLGRGSWLIVDPPPGPVPIPDGNHRYWTTHYPTWNRLPPEKRAKFDINFPTETSENILVFQSRSADRSAWLWTRAAASSPGARMVVAAGNREGGKVTGSRLEATLGLNAVRIASQGRGSLWQTGVPPGPATPQNDWHTVNMAGIEVQVLPGVFGRKGLDPGTALLVECLDRFPVTGPVLDFACGSGILALAVLRDHPGLEVTACDADVLALESTRRNLAPCAPDARIVAVDDARDLNGPFGLIVSNPPFHEGSRPDLDVPARLIGRAPALLAPGGRILIVANRHLPLEREFDLNFASWEKIAENKRFKVLSGLEPRRDKPI